MTKLRTALVLAGGKGERLRPLTDGLPKPMVPCAGRPLLEHHLHWLRANGVERAVLLAGYRGGIVQEYFAVPRVAGLDVVCVVEEEPLGRGGALKNGWRVANTPDEVVVATNGDVVTDQPLGPLLHLHRTTGALATDMLTGMQSPYGVVDVDDAGLVRGFREKPPLPYWINAGVYVLSREALQRFPEHGDHETGLFPVLAAEQKLAGFRSRSFWRSVETQKDLRELEQALGRIALFAPLVR